MPLPSGQIAVTDIIAAIKVNTGGNYTYSGAVSLARILKAANNPQTNSESPTAEVSMGGVRSMYTVHELAPHYTGTWLYWDSRNPACCRRDWGYNEQNSSTTGNYWYSRADQWKIDASHNEGAGMLEPQHGGRWTFNGYSSVMWTAAYIQSAYNSGDLPSAVCVWFQPYDPDVYTNCCWSNRYAISQYYKRFVVPAISPQRWGDLSNASTGLYMSRYRIETYVHGYDWGYCTGAIGIGDRYATPTLAIMAANSGFDLGYVYYNGSANNNYIGATKGKYTVQHIEEICGDAYGRASGKCTMAVFYRYGTFNSEQSGTFHYYTKLGHGRAAD
jgi:hypothetical protein